MSQLPTLLSHEVELVVRFIDALKSEQLALRAGKVDELQGVEENKSELAEQLNAVGAQRNEILAAAGLPPDRPGMRAWLVRHPKDRKTGEAWSRLVKLAGEAKELTRLNGQLLAIHLQATQQALATLTQQAQGSTLYGPNGQTSQFTGSRIIDSV